MLCREFTFPKTLFRICSKLFAHVKQNKTNKKKFDIEHKLKQHSSCLKTFRERNYGEFVEYFRGTF